MERAIDLQYVYEIIKTGEIVEKTMTVAEMKACKRGEESLLPEGLARRRIDIEHGGFKSSHAGWPMQCDASGVHPSQIRENIEYLRAAGVPTQFTPDGRAIYENRSHRAKALKALGLNDRSGGYMETH